MKLLILMIALFFGAAIYNLYDYEPYGVLLFTGLAVVLLLILSLFRREDKRQLAWLEWLIHEKANIYKGKVVEEGIVIQPNTRLIQYDAVISFAFFHFNHSSRLYIKGSRSSRIYGWIYSLITLLFGWWALPWGPILTIKILIFNML